MPQPFNYTLDIPSPTQQVMDILNMRANIQSQQAKQAAAAKAAEQQKALEADIAGLGTNPTPSAIANLSAKYPALSEKFQKTYDMLGNEQQKAHVDTASQVYASLLSGSTEVAQNVLKDRIEAARNAGDEAQVKQMETMSKLIELHPETAKTSTGIFLANAMGKDKFTDTFTGLETSRRERALEPAALKKQGKELGLTEAQTNKVLVENKKLDAEAQKAILELEAMKKGDIVDPEKKFQQERTLSNEYTNKTKNFDGVQEAYRRIKAAEDTAAGDLSLIFSYMKMLDPNSTVREGEFANAQNAGGIDDKVWNLYNNIKTGERLNPGQRKSFKSQSAGLFDAAKKKEESVRAGLQKVIDNYKLNPENVFVTGSPDATEQTETSNSVTVGDQTYTRPEGFTDEQWSAYKQSQGVQ